MCSEQAQPLRMLKKALEQLKSLWHRPRRSGWGSKCGWHRDHPRLDPRWERPSPAEDTPSSKKPKVSPPPRSSNGTKEEPHRLYSPYVKRWEEANTLNFNNI